MQGTIKSIKRERIFTSFIIRGWSAWWVRCTWTGIVYYPGQPAQSLLAGAAPLLILVCAYLHKGNGASVTVLLRIKWKLMQIDCRLLKSRADMTWQVGSGGNRMGRPLYLDHPRWVDGNHGTDASECWVFLLVVPDVAQRRAPANKHQRTWDDGWTLYEGISVSQAWCTLIWLKFHGISCVLYIDCTLIFIRCMHHIVCAVTVVYI